MARLIDWLRETGGQGPALSLDELREGGQCAPDCDPGGNQEDHWLHMSHEWCDTCPYHDGPGRHV